MKDMILSIKNNLDYIKSEFSNDSQLLENTLKLERFYKKYKYIIWTFFVVVILGGISYLIYIKHTEQNAQKYSVVYTQLKDDANNSNLRDELKNGNKKLYDLFLLQQAFKNGNISDFEELKNSNNILISSLASYYIGSFERDISVLKGVDKYTLGDLSKLQQAFLLINENKINDAKLVLGEIPQESNLGEFAKLLTHYMITKQ